MNPLWLRLTTSSTALTAASSEIPPPVQRKPSISAPGDPYEHEADEVAEEVMRMAEPAPIGAAPVAVRRKCATCEEDEEKEPIRTKRDPSAEAAGALDVEAAVRAAAHGGAPLPAATRELLEPRFGYDFGHVRVHADAAAAHAARAVRARAYTIGHNIVFGQGEYAPGSAAGRRLLAHELTHVVQQRLTPSGSDARLQRQPTGGGPPDCGTDFKREFLGKINGEAPKDHRGVPRMYYATIPENEKSPGRPIDPLVTGTELDVGQRGGYGGLWRAVCLKTPTKPAQILWVLNEYILNLDEQRRREEEKKKKKAEPPPQSAVKAPTIAEAFVTLKKAETTRRAQGADYKPTAAEQKAIDAAADVLQKTGKYTVDKGSYVVSFASTPGKKIQINTIEDFILFVEAVEKQYPAAKPSEVASEIRQLWFSDVNWELLVASEGIQESGKHIDIETEPNPIAKAYDMANLAPAAGGKRLATRMGNVDIGHVMAGIDAALSGFPPSYPKAHLAERKHDDSDAQLKYETLKAASGGNSRDFTTWAGDLGQAYAEYLVSRYVKSESAKLSNFMAAKAPSDELLGDIHGYIAVEVWKKVPASASPTGGALKISNILRDLYLVDKSKGGGGAYEGYASTVSGKSGADLRDFVRTRSLAFARPWFAKKAVAHRGWWKSEGWGKKGILENTMAEFDRVHEKNDKEADKADKLDTAVATFMSMLKGSLK